MMPNLTKTSTGFYIKNPKRLLICALSALMLTISGCGGGDGGNESPPITTPDPVIPDPVIPDPVIPDPVIPDPVIPDPVIPDPVIPDTEAPVITIIGQESVEHDYAALYRDLGATANDNTDGSVVVDVTGSVDVNSIGTYTITYTATDSSGNEVQQTRSVNVSDLSPPEILLFGSSVITHAYGSDYVDEGYSATDNFDEEFVVIVSGSVNKNEIDSFTITYTATDSSGNESQVLRVVNVVDTIDPAIKMGGRSEIDHPYGEVYEDQGAIARDNVDGDIPVVVSGEVNENELASFTITYTATDSSGNSRSLVRTVNVVDLAPPVITLVGDAMETHNYADAFIDDGVVVTDNYDASVTAITTGVVDVNTLGQYVITYTATDSSGNMSVALRTVDVADIEGPQITLTGQQRQTLVQGKPYVELGATAEDNLDGVLPVVYPVPNIDTNIVGVYDLTYSATDLAGNESLLTREVEVVEPAPFITEWDTTKTGFSDDSQILIKAKGRDYTYLYSVDWGDGNITEGLTGDYTHTYAVGGVYTVKITGIFPQFYLESAQSNTSDNGKLTRIVQWGEISWKSMNSAFRDTDLSIDASDAPDLSEVTDTSKMFYASTMDQDISHWDMSTIQNTSYMFYEGVYNQPLNMWDVGNVTNMTSMFQRNRVFNQDIGDWNVGAVTATSRMFSGAYAFNQDLNRWAVSNLVTATSMFESASAFNQPLSGWDVSKVKYAASFFRYAQSFNQDIGSWSTGSFTSTSGMFHGASSFNQDIGAWNVSNVLNMNDMFKNTIFDHDIGAWVVSKVTSMSGMFHNATVFNQDIGSWDVSSVKYMQNMFQSASAFDQDLSLWDTSKVERIMLMFYNATAFNQSLAMWSIESLTYANNAFDLSGLSTENYSSTLIGWAGQGAINTNVTLGATAFRTIDTQSSHLLLTSSYGWVITDGGVELL